MNLLTDTPKPKEPTPIQKAREAAAKAYWTLKVLAAECRRDARIIKETLLAPQSEDEKREEEAGL